MNEERTGKYLRQVEHIRDKTHESKDESNIVLHGNRSEHHSTKLKNVTCNLTTRIPQRHLKTEMNSGAQKACFTSGTRRVAYPNS
jgi:hypothetical protein